MAAKRHHILPTMTGEEIRAKREAKGWSPAELGEMIGRSQRQIYRYETGESPIDGMVSIALRQVLGEPVTYRAQSPKRKSAKSSKRSK